MKKIIYFIFFAMTAPIFADDSNPPGNDENVLIFTGEVRNFIDLASSVNTEDEKKMEDQVKVLQLTSSRIADAYFQEENEANRERFSVFLADTLKENQNLKNYFIIMGNAFATEAQKLLNDRGDKMHKIAVWSTVGGVVLGLAGGYLVFQYTKSAAKAGIVGVGIAAVAAGGGYSARYFIPVEESVQTAQDFIQRFPKGEDFIRDVESKSSDLNAILEEAEELEGEKT